MARMKTKSGSTSAVGRIEKKLAQALNGLKQQYQKGSTAIEKQISRTEAKLSKLQGSLEKAKSKQRAKALTQTIRALKSALREQQRMLANYQKEYQQLLVKNEVGSAEKAEPKMKAARTTKRGRKAKTGRRGRTKAAEVAPNVGEAMPATTPESTDTWTEERAEQTSEAEELETSEA